MNIKEHRKTVNMTQDDLARALGVSKSLISRYENGHTQPPISMILKMSKIFGVNTNDFIISDYVVRCDDQDMLKKDWVSVEDMLPGTGRQVLVAYTCTYSKDADWTDVSYAVARYDYEDETLSGKKTWQRAGACNVQFPELFQVIAWMDFDRYNNKPVETVKRCGNCLYGKAIEDIEDMVVCNYDATKMLYPVAKKGCSLIWKPKKQISKKD